MTLKKVLLAVVVVVLSAIAGFFVWVNQDRYGCLYGVHGLKVWDFQIYIAREHGYNYCAMLRQAFRSDEGLKAFIMIDGFDGEYAYNHGDLVNNLSVFYGDKLFWQKLGQLNKLERLHVQGLLEAGQEYGRIQPMER